jgi:hypothetical protein
VSALERVGFEPLRLVDVGGEDARDAHDRRDDRVETR